MKRWLLLFAFSLCSCGGPSNFDQCVLKNVGNDMNEAAVGVVTQACLNEFPPEEQPKQAGETVPQDDLALLTGRGRGYLGTFDGTVYNGTPYNLSSLTIAITTTDNGVPLTREYATDVSIAPQTTGNISFSIVEGDQGSDVQWAIYEAKYKE